MTTAKGHQAWAPRIPFFTAVFFLWIAFSLGTCAVSSLFSACVPVKLRMTQPALPHNMLLCRLPASPGQQLPLFDMLNQAPPARRISHSYCFISVASSELCILIFDVWNLSWFKDYPGEFRTPGDEWSGRKSQPFHTEGWMESFTGIGYWNMVFMVALFEHLWSAPKQSVAWDAKYLSSVATFSLRQNEGKIQIKSWWIERWWTVLLRLRTKGFTR